MISILKSNKYTQKRILLIGGILLIFLNLGAIQQVVAVEDVSFKLSRIMGTGFGNNIEGKMKISCSGSDGITSLKLYFNSSVVAESSTNSLIFQFDTGDYGVGEMNITLIGKDSSNQEYSYSQIFKFLSSNINYILIPAVIAIVIASFAYKFYQRKSHKKSINSSDEEKKKKIDINIDKDFL